MLSELESVTCRPQSSPDDIEGQMVSELNVTLGDTWYYLKLSHGRDKSPHYLHITSK